MHARAIQQGGNAACERPIGRSQRYRDMSIGQMLQHAGGGQLGLVFRVTRAVQCDQLGRACIQCRLRHIGRKRLDQ